MSTVRSIPFRLDIVSRYRLYSYDIGILPTDTKEQSPWMPKTVETYDSFRKPYHLQLVRKLHTDNTSTKTSTRQDFDSTEEERSNTNPTNRSHNHNNNSNVHIHLSQEEKTRNQWRAIFSQIQSIPNMITISRIALTPYLSYLILTQQYTLATYGCILAAISDWVDGYIAKNYGGGTVLGTYLDPLADKIFINVLAMSLAFATVPMVSSAMDAPSLLTSILSHDILGSMDSLGMESANSITTSSSMENQDTNTNQKEEFVTRTILPSWCVLTWFLRDALLISFSYRAAAKAAKGRDHNIADPARTPLKVQPSMISKINTVFQFATIGSGLGLGLDITHYPVVLGMCYLSTTTTIISGIDYFWTGKAIVLASENRKNEQP